MDKKGALATFDAITFFMIATIASMVITLAVMESSDTQDLRETRYDMDETTYSLSVILQYSIKSAYYTNETGANITLEEKSILNLIDFILTNRELNRNYNTSDIEGAIEREIRGVMASSFCITASSRNHDLAIPEINPPQDIISTSVTAPASEDLGGTITITLCTWD
jgi:hypothetical protein